MSGGIDSSRFQGALSAYWLIYEGLSKRYEDEYSECQREFERVGQQVASWKSTSGSQKEMNAALAEMKHLAQRVSRLYQDLQKGADFLSQPFAIPRFKKSETSINQELQVLSGEIFAKQNLTKKLEEIILDWKRQGKNSLRAVNIEEERRVKGTIASTWSWATGTGAYQEELSKDMSMEGGLSDDRYDLGRALDAYQIVYGQLIARHDKIAEGLNSYLEGIREKTEAWKQVSASENPDADKQEIEQAMKDMNDHYKRICRLSDHLTQGREFLEQRPIPEFQRKTDADDLKEKSTELLAKRDWIDQQQSDVQQLIQLAEVEGNKALAHIGGLGVVPGIARFTDWSDWVRGRGAYRDREDSGYGEYTSSSGLDNGENSSRVLDRRTHTFGETETAEYSEETGRADEGRRSDLIDDAGSFSEVLERMSGRDASASWEEQDEADGSGQGMSSGGAISELNSNFDGILADYRELPGTVRATKLFSEKSASLRRRNEQGSSENIERNLGEILDVSPIQHVRDRSYGNVDELDLDASGSSMGSPSVSAMMADSSRLEEAALSAQNAQAEEESDASSVGTEDGSPYMLEELIVSGDDLFDSEFSADAEALGQMEKRRSFYSVEELTSEQSDAESQIGNAGSIGDREFPRLGRTDETTSGETPNAAKTLGGMVSEDPLESQSAPAPVPQPKKKHRLIQKLFRKKPPASAAPSPMKEEELDSLGAQEAAESSQNSVRIEDDSFG